MTSVSCSYVHSGFFLAHHLAPGVHWLPVDCRGRPGEFHRCVAPLGGGAIFRGGDDAPVTHCATGPAGCPLGRSGEGSPESGAEVGPLEGLQRTVR